MILFYSIGCNHSKMLLDNVSRYDKDKKIKLVPIDELKKQNINIETKIHTVPAFMILPSKEILFGKDVFDYLLLPGRGILCSSQSTRLDKNINDKPIRSVESNAVEKYKTKKFMLNKSLYFWTLNFKTLLDLL